MQRVSSVGLDFNKGFESFVPYVYDDLVPARRVGGRLVYREWKPGDPIVGTLTIGYGHTDDARYDLGFDLANVPPNFRLTEAQAAHILDVDLDEVEQSVNQLVKVPITQGQFDALVSLTFNMGAGNLKKSTLLARLNRGDYDGARAAFDLYVKSKGVTLRGLQRRRDGEQDLWDQNIPTTPAEPVDHPADVDQDTVPTPPANMAQSSEGNAAVVTGASGTGVMTDAVINAANRVSERGTTWDTFLLDMLLALMASPQFWVGLTITVLSAYAWLQRRNRLVTQGV